MLKEILLEVILVILEDESELDDEKALLNKFSFDERKKSLRRMEGIGKQLASSIDIDIELLKYLTLEFLYKNKEYLRKLDKQYDGILMKDVMKVESKEVISCRKKSLTVSVKNIGDMSNSHVLKGFKEGKKQYDDKNLNLGNDFEHMVNNNGVSLDYIHLKNNIKFEEILSTDLKNISSIV